MPDSTPDEGVLIFYLLDDAGIEDADTDSN